DAVDGTHGHAAGVHAVAAEPRDDVGHASPRKGRGAIRAVPSARVLPLQHPAGGADSALFLNAGFALSSPVVAVAFPSLEFFQTLQREVAAERERFSRLGYFDTTFGIRILQDGGAAEFTVAFEVFDCVRVVDGIEPE